MNETITPTVNYHDLNSLHSLRSLGARDEKAALKAAAQQFEATFLNMLLKSMRDAGEVFSDEDDGINGGDVGFYQGMHDEQLAATLSGQGALGLADLMVQQLSGTSSIVPSSNGSGLDRQGFSRSASAPVESALPTSILNDPSTNSQPALLPHDAWMVPPHLLQVRQELQKQWQARSEGVGLINSAQTVSPAPATANAPVTDPQSFVRNVLPHARRAAQALGIDEKVLIAQAALETGWGKSLPASGNNCFGIKGDSQWQGTRVSRRTLEVEQGLPVTRFASFRAYDDIGASFADYVQFVRAGERYNAAEQAGNARDYVQALAKGGYATDPAYAQKVMSIYQRPELTQWIAAAGDTSPAHSSL